MYALYLDNNSIKNIVFNGSFPNLTYITLNDNKLEALDNMTSQTFPILSTLYLNNNKLKKVGPNISLKTLSTLDLSNN